MAGSARPSQCAVAGMAAVLQPRNDRSGLSDCEQLRGAAGATLSASAAQTPDAGHAPVSLATHLWETRCGPAGPATRTCVCVMITLSESRMLEIGTSGLMSGGRKRTGGLSPAPRLSSTLQLSCFQRNHRHRTREPELARG